MSLSSFQTDAKKAAQEELTNAPETLQKLIATYNLHFPATATLSSVQQEYSAESNFLQNAAMDKTMSATVDAVDAVLSAIKKFEQYITLTIPQMEDGGNFGVSIQLNAIKAQTELADKLNKGLDEVLKYMSSRAEALEKCKLPSSSTTKSSTSSTSDASGTDKEKGETKTTSTSKATEEKTTEKVDIDPAQALRKAAVVAVDINFYTKAKGLLSQAVTGYMATVDYMEKNKTKLEKPKGDGGRAGGYSGMY